MTSVFFVLSAPVRTFCSALLQIPVVFYLLHTASVTIRVRSWMDVCKYTDSVSSYTAILDSGHARVKKLHSVV